MQTINQTVSRTKNRFSALDLQRGCIIVLMALSHCREYVGIQYDENLSWFDSFRWHSNSTVDIIQHIFVSTVVAGGFYLFMGIGVFFLWNSRSKQGWTSKQILFYLVKRGSLLIALQLTLMELFEVIAEQTFYLYLGVLMTLGLCMILAGLCLYISEFLEKKISYAVIKPKIFIPILIICILFSLGHFILANESLTQPHSTTLKSLLWLGGIYRTHSFYIDINYTPLPWFSSVAMGLVIGNLLKEYERSQFKVVFSLSLIFLCLFFTIRSVNIYGSFLFGYYNRLIELQSINWLSFFAISKYPPSISYFFWSWGVNLLGLSFWFKIANRFEYVSNTNFPLIILGQTALLFFILHWPVYLLLSKLMNYKVTSASALLLIWLIGLLFLIPLCHYYHKFKYKTDVNSFWRMF
jgi:uncharacterized membrane protein